MMETLPVYIGWDPRDDLAYKVAVASLRARATIPVSIRPILDWELRESGIYWRPYTVEENGQMRDHADGKPFSTQFSFTRFCVPLLEKFDSEWAVYTDADVLWRADIDKLMQACRERVMLNQNCSVLCVKHNHMPKERTKMWGTLQTTYERKNWSSVMVFRPWQCKGLNSYAVNNRSGAWLHAMCWTEDANIGELDMEWNWLAGYCDPEIVPSLVHYTLGTPDQKGREGDAYAAEWREYADRCRT